MKKKFLVVLLMVILQGCGQSGRLYLPDERVVPETSGLHHPGALQSANDIVH